VLSVAVLLQLQDLESKIVAACAGMPLLLELAGSRLRYKRDIEYWEVKALLCMCWHTLSLLVFSPCGTSSLTF
jgi:hypothetical protein